MVNPRKTILECLKFCDIDLDNLKSVNEKLKVWRSLRDNLFFDYHDIFFGRREDLGKIQNTIIKFRDDILLPITDAADTVKWDERPDRAVDRIAKQYIKEKKTKEYKEAISLVGKNHPALFEAYVRRKWIKTLPEVHPQRYVHAADGKYFKFAERYENITDHAVSQLIKILALSPLIPLSTYYRCIVCNQWTYRNSKFKTCSKNCYDNLYKKKERSTPEGKKKNRERSKLAYRKKALGK